MSRSPSIRFRDSLNEAIRLMEIHIQLTGTGPGRRRDVEVLNKSAILFMCASFEAFIEVLATESFNHLVSDAPGPNGLPKAMRRSVAEVLKNDKNELKVWDLAGDGWRHTCANYRNAVVSKYTGPFNTPKPHNIEALFRELIGMSDLPAHWKWPKMTAANASAKLKTFVELRGSLAHGEHPPPKVTKKDVQSWLVFLAPLSVRSSNQVRAYCHAVTGKYPWNHVQYNAVA